MTTPYQTADLIRNLSSVLTRQRLVALGAGLLLLGAAFLGLVVIYALLAQAFVLPVWVKLTLSGIALAGLVTGLFALVVRPYRTGSVDQVAVTLETRHPELKGRLIAAVQFSRGIAQPGVSEDLIMVTIRQAIERAGGIDLAEIVSFNPLWKSARSLALAGAAALALTLAIPGLYAYAIEVYGNPLQKVAPPIAYRLAASPGSTQWIKYKDIPIGAALVGQRLPDEARLHYRLAGGSWQSQDFDLKRQQRLAVPEGDSLSFGTTLRQINKSFEYYVEAGELATDVHQIEVVDRPRVNNVSVAIFPPSYTGLSPQMLDENTGSFSAVFGSRATLKFETNLPVKICELLFEDSSRAPVNVTGNRAELSLRVDKTVRYQVRLVDQFGEQNPDPIEYTITAIPDEYPIIDVLYPGFDANLTDAMILPVKLRIEDDFGFSSLVLKYQVVSQGSADPEQVAVLHYPATIKTEGEVEFNWDMDQLGLFPGDYVGYYFELADNDRISGPKISRTRQYLARLPSLEDVIAQTEQAGQQRISATERLMKTGKELVQRMQTAVRKLDSQTREQRKTDWQQQKELQGITDKSAEMLKDVEKLARQMDSAMNAMKENALMSREVMEKMAQIQKLFEEVATPEMREAQKKLMEALQKMDRQQLEKAMKDFQLSQDELLKRLERTLALLKKMQVEQKMEALLRQVEDLVKKQSDMNASTEQAPADKLNQLAGREQELADNTEALKKEAAELRDLMQQAEMEKNEAANKFAEALEKTEANQKMSQMAKSLAQGDKQQSEQNGKESSQELSALLQEMQNQQMAMKGGDSQATKQAMQRAMEDANSVSQSQEELMNAAAAMDPRSLAMRDLAEQQRQLQGACNSLQATVAALGKQSPFLAGELSSLFEQAKQQMETATEQFDSRQGPSGRQMQRDAMSTLNKASLRLMESLEQQKQCDKGGNCDQSMAKLESLCNSQNNVNMQTQQQCNNPQNLGQGGASREAMQRLAGEQGAIRKSVEELEKEFGDSRQIMGRLSDIGRAMKEIEDDLADGEAGEETVERQLRVYSRMLEATRSLQRRELTEQRRAQTPTETPLFQPQALPAELLNDRTNFEDRLRQYLGAGYPPQYEEQIKAYFRALLQLESQPGAIAPRP